MEAGAKERYKEKRFQMRQSNVERDNISFDIGPVILLFRAHLRAYFFYLLLTFVIGINYRLIIYIAVPDVLLTDYFKQELMK